MSAFDSVERPEYTQGWNSYMLSDGQYSMCPYSRGKKRDEWWAGYKAASYHFKGCPWTRGKRLYGLEP